jgi:hypothetical protein
VSSIEVFFLVHDQRNTPEIFLMTSAHYTYVVNKMLSALKLIASQPTTYEGLYAACLGPVLEIDADRDLPVDERVRFVRWRNRVLPGSARPCAISDFMATLRRMSPSEAQELAVELACIANQMMVKR